MKSIYVKLSIIIDGIWSEWTDWDSECEKSDDSNIWKKSRTRTCTEPEPKYNGLQCCFNRKNYYGNDILREVGIENETKCQEKCSENIGKKHAFKQDLKLILNPISTSP